MGTLYLCGAGNSEGVRLALAINREKDRWDRILLLDDDPTKHGESRLGVEIAGPFELLLDAEPEHDEVANLVARTTVKRRAARDRIAAYGIPFATLLSPEIDTLGVEYAGDVMAYQHAILGPEVSIDEGTVVFMGGIVGHECRVGRSCVIAANAVLNARVVLEDEVYIGTNASVLPEVTIGRGATIGAGSVVFQDVPAGATAIGVPAQIMATTPVIPETVSGRSRVTPSRSSRSPAPASLELERDIAGIWRDVLHVESVGPEQNFFDLGGDSLLALRVCERIKAALGGETGIMDLFQYPTVRALAGHVGNGHNGGLGATPAHDHDHDDDRASRRREMMQRRKVSRN